MTTPTPDELDALLCTLGNAADNKGLDIGTAWNLLDESADAITALRAQVAEARREPADEELDAMDANLRACCYGKDHSVEKDNFCKVADAITALRAQVAEARVLLSTRVEAKRLDEVMDQLVEARCERDHWKRTCEMTEDRFAEARKRSDRVVAVWEDQEVRGWWDRMDAAIAALGGE